MKIEVDRKIVYISVMLNILLLFSLSLSLRVDNNRIQKLEKYIDMNEFEFMGVHIDENMTIQEIRSKYYYFKSYPQHEFIINNILDEVCK